MSRDGDRGQSVEVSLSVSGKSEVCRLDISDYLRELIEIDDRQMLKRWLCDGRISGEMIEDFFGYYAQFSGGGSDSQAEVAQAIQEWLASVSNVSPTPSLAIDLCRDQAMAWWTRHASDLVDMQPSGFTIH